MVSSQQAYAASSSGAIIRTLDGGQTWTLDYTPSYTNTAVTLSIAMSSQDNGQRGVAGMSRGGKVLFRVPGKKNRVKFIRLQ